MNCTIGRTEAGCESSIVKIVCKATWPREEGHNERTEQSAQHSALGAVGVCGGQIKGAGWCHQEPTRGQQQWPLLMGTLFPLWSGNQGAN